MEHISHINHAIIPYMFTVSKMVASSVATDVWKERVTFSEVFATKGCSQTIDSDVPSFNESFVEIITSEEHLFSSCAEEDETHPQMMLEGIYSYNSALFSSDCVDPVETELLPLLAKDLLNNDESVGL